ncbi:chorismate mutase [Pantoea sp. Bo_2]|uniref:Chorismate mutase n=1 Tax=Candidatus Pantoea gossypiicola TaxID=2608008 RepID=A0AB34CGW0_9GAMM|nr:MULTISPECIES: chorismate mutase [Pantoea]KAA5927475.1 chorismate mutase [Pantoea sp. VH_8]KAA5931814.1 chorismate mutase [Pantoea sp. VH_4]KAA5939445.1 chorismate mutase [Pantoea sp. VH_3]KAA5948413.1 chorismate mutase [Pantoea sp. VH_25]KAA5951559.1 chorismate mutase [Pantoea sp. VH_24]
MMQYVAVFLSSLFMCSNVFAGSVSSVSLDALSTALNERMQVMKAVAGYKAQHHLSVEDLPREQVVLDNMLHNAQQAGLEPQSVEPFVHALMNASKAIQYRYRADWLSAPESDVSVVDLAVTRQQIERLDNQVLAAISQHLMTGTFSQEDKAFLMSQLTAPHLSESDKNNLFASLARIQRSH